MGTRPYRIVRRAEHLVLTGRNGDTYVARLDALESPRWLGQSPYFLPSAHPGRVWLVTGSASTAAVNSVREVTVDGRITVAAANVPNGMIPVAADAGGLVLEGGDQLQVWDPRSDRTRTAVPGSYLAASGDTLAWCRDPSCLVIGRRPVVRLDSRRGADRQRTRHGPGDCRGDRDRSLLRSRRRTTMSKPFDAITGLERTAPRSASRSDQGRRHPAREAVHGQRWAGNPRPEPGDAGCSSLRVRRN